MAMMLESLILSKPIHVDGSMENVLYGTRFEIVADIERRLVYVTARKNGRKIIIPFEGLVAMTPSEAQQKVEAKPSQRRTA